MKVVITYDPPQGGEDFHEQTLYYVPREVARSMIADFASFRSDSDHRPFCETYEYALTNGRDGNDADGPSAEEPPVETPPAGAEGTERKGIVALDFRKIATIHAFDPYSE